MTRRCTHPFGEGDVIHGTVCGYCRKPLVRGPNGQAVVKGDERAALEQIEHYTMQWRRQIGQLIEVAAKVEGSKLDTLRAQLKNAEVWLDLAVKRIRQDRNQTPLRRGAETFFRAKPCA